MKRIKRFWAILLGALLFAGCAAGGADNVTFTAVIEQVMENGILVTTTDDVGFDKASVGFDKSCKINFNLLAGQTVELTILPQIRESYPVQVTAVKIELKAMPQEKQESTATAVYQKIDARAAKEKMDAEKDRIILDVRTQSEYDEGHIEGALLLPDTEIADRAEEKLPDKNATVLVYCRSGRRSEEAAKALMEMGYSSVYDFGGILDWPYETVK